MSNPRNHHFIPVFYLKQWTVGGKLIEYTKKHGRFLTKRVGPAATGFQRDLYSFPELPPKQSQFIESVFLNYADDKAAQVLAVHLGNSSTPWNSELVSAWTRFLFGIHLRHPDAMDEIRPGVIANWEMSDEATQKEYEKIRQPNDPPTFNEYWQQRDPLLPTKVRVNMIVGAVMDNEIVGTHVNKMKWHVIDVSQHSYRFLTSDRPLMMFQIRKADGYIALPISPTQLFIATNTDDAIKRLRRASAKNTVAKANLHVVSRARRFVYARDDTQRRFVANRVHTKLEAKPFFPNFGTPTFSEAAAFLHNDAE